MKPDGPKLRETLEHLVRAHARIDLPHVADQDILGHELGLDSHALLNLLLDVEDAVGIEIAPAEVAALAGIRFGAFVDFVQTAVRSAQAGREAYP